MIELIPAPPQVLPVEAWRLAGQAQQIHLQGQRVHVSREAVGGDLQLVAWTARPLLAFPLVLADLGAAAGLLGSRTLESRIGGVGAVGVVANTAGPGAEDLPLLGQEGPSQQGLLALRAAEAGLGGMPVLAVIRHLALVDTLRGKMHSVRVSPRTSLHTALNKRIPYERHTPGLTLESPSARFLWCVKLSPFLIPCRLQAFAQELLNVGKGSRTKPQAISY